MLSKLLPAFLKRAINTHIRIITSGGRELYVQSRPGENAYCLKANELTAMLLEGERFPIPPKEFWVGYASDAQGYIGTGKCHVTEMVRLLEQSGFSIRSAKRILEFGCAAGRMIRHLPEIAPTAELWGVDQNAERIRWCIENLTPAIHFATTTMVPHLPFEDRYFDLIFCGSVFTHIEDIQESWLLELGRVLRPSGKLYFTIHDEHTVTLLDKCPGHLLAKEMQEQPAYCTNKNDFDMIVVGRGTSSQVFYNSRYLQFITPPIFQWISHTTEAYAYQSAVILEKLRTD
jgi:ubiquinone/menaquinone biosynthesis C-methylase UbiE